MLEELIKDGENLKNMIKYYRSSEPNFFYSYNKLDNTSGYEFWKNNVIRFLSTTFKGDRCITDFEEKIKVFEHNNSPKNFDALLGILKACLILPSIVPAKSQVSSGGVVITNQNNNENHATQNQTVILNIFIEAIKDEITGNQFKELKNIIKEEPDAAKAKSKIVEKVKSFGENVMANIVSNIITNPAIWGFLPTSF